MAKFVLKRGMFEDMHNVHACYTHYGVCYITWIVVRAI